jgi:hypothetical protein
LHYSCLKIWDFLTQFPRRFFFGLFVFLTGVVVGASVWFICYYSRLVFRSSASARTCSSLSFAPSIGLRWTHWPPAKIPFLLVRTGPVNFSTPSLSPPCWCCVQSKLKFLMHFLYPLRQTCPDIGLVLPAWTGLFLVQRVRSSIPFAEAAVFPAVCLAFPPWFRLQVRWARPQFSSPHRSLFPVPRPTCLSFWFWFIFDCGSWFGEHACMSKPVIFLSYQFEKVDVFFVLIALKWFFPNTSVGCLMKWLWEYKLSFSLIFIVSPAYVLANINSHFCCDP